jgi:SET and MYND domain-containing protein
MSVQLMSMKKHGIMSEVQWQEVLRLRTNGHLVSEEFQAVNNAMIRIAQDLSGCREEFPNDYPIGGMVSGVASILLPLFTLALILPQDIYIHHYLSCVQLRTNRYSLTAPSYDSLGSALDLMVAKANHSCNPNAYVIMDGPIISIRTIRPIAKNEEILITYVDTTEPYYMRQHALKTNWFFTCHCPKCQEGPSKEDNFRNPPSEEFKEICQSLKKPTTKKAEKKDPLDIDSNAILVNEMNFLGTDPDSKILSIAQSAFKRHADLALECENEETRATVLHRVYTLWSQTKMWSEHRYPMLYVRNELVLTNIEAEQRYEAMLHAAKIHFETYPIKYPEPHTLMRVVNEFRLVKLILDVLFDGMMNGNIKPGDLHYPILIWGILNNLVKNVDKSHGENSRFSKMVKEKLDEFSSGANTEELKAYYEAPGNFEKEKQILLQTAEKALKEAERSFVRSDEPLPRQFKRLEDMLGLS